MIMIKKRPQTKLQSDMEQMREDIRRIAARLDPDGDGCGAKQFAGPEKPGDLGGAEPQGLSGEKVRSCAVSDKGLIMMILVPSHATVSFLSQSSNYDDSCSKLHYSLNSVEESLL